MVDLVRELDHRYTITRIYVPADIAAIGIAGGLLNVCIFDADAEGVTLSIKPRPTSGMKFGQLMDWFARRGFIWSGKSDGLMVRAAPSRSRR